MPVFNQDRAKQFYIDNFACQTAADAPMGEDGWRWIELKFAGADTALHFIRRPDDAPSADPVLVLIDDKVEATTDALKAKGVEIITEPKAAPYDPTRMVAEFRDSEGNRMVLSSR
ncbi:VOC family protein [Devosia sp.]|uniref:VOC family protein n=1 Tax=Devosia sp. TaxID=1871048 RepID=UPI00263407FE|nr:VOC family protein [Devosia sp.]